MNYQAYNSGISERKAKILSFIEKDNIVVNNYESSAFKNKSHAIECLIPYHIFQVMADDVKFNGADYLPDVNKEIASLCGKIEDMVPQIHSSRDEFTSQLLLYYEQRYFNNLAQQKKTQPVAPKKKEKSPPQKATFPVRIPKSKSLYVFGPINALRLKLSKKKDAKPEIN
ncbi:hypothetical protein ENBRE01_1117 [Enteropsectra breve]|nr:hypothetical protein ENBRE01_1117 [Enteropsectra breve]